MPRSQAATSALLKCDSMRTLKSRETGAPETAQCFRIFHKRVPHESSAQILGHHQGYPCIDCNHIRVVPLLHGIECIHESIAAPRLVSVTILHMFEDSQGGLGQKR